MESVTLNERIAEMVAPTLESLGYRLVQVRLSEGGRRTLQIMAERKDERNMTVEDCAAISHQLSAVLDVEDPITGEYSLEISSPGIDRPLITREDFMRHDGFEAKIETKLAVEGRKRFKGMLAGVEGEDVVIMFDNQTTRIPFHQIHAAKLLLTDALIRAALGQQQAAGESPAQP